MKAKKVSDNLKSMVSDTQSEELSKEDLMAVTGGGFSCVGRGTNNQGCTNGWGSRIT
jgi:hypothetical protein